MVSTDIVFWAVDWNHCVKAIAKVYDFTGHVFHTFGFHDFETLLKLILGVFIEDFGFHFITS